MDNYFKLFSLRLEFEYVRKLPKKSDPHAVAFNLIIMAFKRRI